MNKLRPILSVIMVPMLPVLTVAVIYFMYRIGAFDSLARERVQRMSQDGMMHGAPYTWYGVPIWQFPDDLVAYQEIVAETTPDVIIETGTYQAGLSVYLAGLLEEINPDAKVLSVDIDTTLAKKSLENLSVKGKDRIKARIVLFEGSSTAPEVLEGMKKHIKPGNKVLVILDSNHTKEHVAKELELYAPLVTPGSYLIVNDTYLETYNSSWDQSGAMPALREFLAKDKRFVVDTARNKYMITCAPGGFLKRQE
ncbi:MAG: cephalosporin hydroxylase family protein [Gemmataceae bacterium]|nr:cephalosporin hydroxylase family protein [Gemmataceae bacterium]